MPNSVGSVLIYLVKWESADLGYTLYSTQQVDLHWVLGEYNHQLEAIWNHTICISQYYMSVIKL
jgi:hypothetical protein